MKSIQIINVYFFTYLKKGKEIYLFLNSFLIKSIIYF